MVGFLILGQEMIRILYLGGEFTENDVQVVWIVLLGMEFLWWLVLRDVYITLPFMR